MNWFMNNKIESLINIFLENMVHFIFLLKNSHLKKYHKIGFTIFGSPELEIWFLQESQKSRFWIKEKEGRGWHWQWTPAVRFFSLTAKATLAGDFSATARSPAKPTAPTWSPDPGDSIDPLFPMAEPPEGARRRWWRLGGGARRYAGVLRPVERDLGFPTAPGDYGGAS